MTGILLVFWSPAASTLAEMYSRCEEYCYANFKHAQGTEFFLKKGINNQNKPERSFVVLDGIFFVFYFFSTGDTKGGREKKKRGQGSTPPSWWRSVLQGLGLR